jgi:hypothetical protein
MKQISSLFSYKYYCCLSNYNTCYVSLSNYNTCYVNFSQICVSFSSGNSLNATTISLMRNVLCDSHRAYCYICVTHTVHIAKFV